MSKGIAIETILLILVGIIVVGVLVYLIYSYTSTGQLSAQECRARLTELCMQCAVKGFSTAYTLNTTITLDCSKYAEFSGWSGVNNCNNAKTDGLCKELGIA